MRKKTVITLSIAYIILMVATGVIQQLDGSTPKWGAMSGRAAASLIPLLLLFMKRIPFPAPLIASYYALIFCTFYLGATIRLYDKFPWWDTATHFVGGAFMAFIAASLYKMLIPHAEDRNITAWLLFLFTLSFSIFASVIWEVIEFAGSEIGPMEADSQKDTMTDLIAGLIGALVAAFAVIVVRMKGKMSDH